jgi:hypothetical protein
MAVKKKEHENLSGSNIMKVYGLLNGDKPITKKQACEILNISYNTKRLDTIISDYFHQREVETKNRSAKKGTPATDDEIKEIIISFLKGEAVSNIAKSLFRSTSFVNGIIDKVGVPRKLTKDEDRKKAIIPDQCVSEDFEEGEAAWSVRYNAGCVVEKELGEGYISKYGSKCYQVYILEPLSDHVEGYNSDIGGFTAFVPAYELASLRHLKQYCPNLEKILKC